MMPDEVTCPICRHYIVNDDHIYMHEAVINVFAIQSKNTGLDFSEFVQLATMRPPGGLGLTFKPGEAIQLFDRIDKDGDASLSLEEILFYFTSPSPGGSASTPATPIPRCKRIALVAHDRHKERLVDWCRQWRAELNSHQLMGTGTTARYAMSFSKVHM